MVIDLCLYVSLVLYVNMLFCVRDFTLFFFILGVWYICLSLFFLYLFWFWARLIGRAWLCIVLLLLIGYVIGFLCVYL